VIDRVYPVTPFKEAFTYAESGRAKGKIILKMIDSFGNARQREPPPLRPMKR